MEEEAGGHTHELAFGHIARLASALARPLESFDESAWRNASLTPRAMRNLSNSPHFGGAVRVLAMRTVVGPDFDMPAATFPAIVDSLEGRFGLRLMSAPVAEIEQVSLLVAAAILHRAVLHTTAKLERQRLQLALGSAAFVVATQEAPVLYPALAATEAPYILRAILSASSDDAQDRRGFVRFGLATLLCGVATAAPQIERLVQRRLPPDLQGPFKFKPPELDFALIDKLIRRRMPVW